MTPSHCICLGKDPQSQRDAFIPCVFVLTEQEVATMQIPSLKEINGKWNSAMLNFCAAHWAAAQEERHQPKSSRRLSHEPLFKQVFCMQIESNWRYHYNVNETLSTEKISVKGVQMHILKPQRAITENVLWLPRSPSPNRLCIAQNICHLQYYWTGMFSLLY